LSVKIAASILSADYGHLARDVKRAEEAGADMIHFDIMDGHFVPNITFGHGVVQALRGVCGLPFFVHLMTFEPERQVEKFASAGADIIAFHLEASRRPLRLLRLIRDQGTDAGISLNPQTALSAAKGLLKEVDVLLLMTVRPGFAGQRLMRGALPKVRAAKDELLAEGLRTPIAVDGGINPKTAPLATRAGADILIAGSAIFGRDVEGAIKDLRGGIPAPAEGYRRKRQG
jgi:ribulose-phosphate 3-epimerase